jgi:hypothetical protein
VLDKEPVVKNGEMLIKSFKTPESIGGLINRLRVEKISYRIAFWEEKYYLFVNEEEDNKVRTRTRKKRTLNNNHKYSFVSKKVDKRPLEEDGFMKIRDDKDILQRIWDAKKGTAKIIEYKEQFFVLQA